jgi:hypothetical protein
MALAGNSKEESRTGGNLCFDHENSGRRQVGQQYRRIFAVCGYSGAVWRQFSSFEYWYVRRKVLSRLAMMMMVTNKANGRFAI